jgi:uncharacterized protein (DUF934 family)
MPLIKNDLIVEDSWVFLADDEALPSRGQVVVSLERWQEQARELLKSGLRLGVKLRSGQRAEEIANNVDALSMIALEFPKFTDGRSYSTARLLRERYGFAGELRAVGDILRDQLFFMLRCGFDSFEIADGIGLEAWLEATREIRHVYQPTHDGRLSILRQRLATAKARLSVAAEDGWCSPAAYRTLNDPARQPQAAVA